MGLEYQSLIHLPAGKAVRTAADWITVAGVARDLLRRHVLIEVPWDGGPEEILQRLGVRAAEREPDAVRVQDLGCSDVGQVGGGQGRRYPWVFRQIEGKLHVQGRDRKPVVPGDVAAQVERDPAFVERPGFGQPWLDAKRGVVDHEGCVQQVIDELVRVLVGADQRIQGLQLGRVAKHQRALRGCLAVAVGGGTRPRHRQAAGNDERARRGSCTPALTTPAHRHHAEILEEGWDGRKVAGAGRGLPPARPAGVTAARSTRRCSTFPRAAAPSGVRPRSARPAPSSLPTPPRIRTPGPRSGLARPEPL